MATGQLYETTIEPNRAQFEFVRRPPSPRLAGVVTGLIGFRELVPVHVRQTEVASLDVPLVISFGDPFAIGLSRPPGDNDRFASFAAGIHAGPVIIDSFGRSCCIQVNFTPLGGRRFFGLPMSQLADRMVPFDDVLGAAGRQLRERLGEESDWQRRLDMTEVFVLERLMRMPAISSEISWAMERIAATGGRSSIASVATEIGWSRKHLANRFTDQVGVGPKTVARIIRFNCAAKLSRRADRAGWADLAAECGYADQAHMVREFRALAGATPTGLG